MGQAEAVRQACGGDAGHTACRFLLAQNRSNCTHCTFSPKTNEQRKSGDERFCDISGIAVSGVVPRAMLEVPSHSHHPMMTRTNHYLRARLRQIVNRLCLPEEEVVETGGRYAIGVQFGWAREVAINFGSYDDGQYLLVQIWPGDTKGQGGSLYREGKQLSWAKTVAGYPIGGKTLSENSAISIGAYAGWHLTGRARLGRHTDTSFSEIIPVRVKREQWPEFDRALAEIIPGWKQEEYKGRPPFEECFEQSGRGYFDISTGFSLTVRIPYAEAQSLDVDQSTSVLHSKIRESRGRAPKLHEIQLGFSF